MRLFSFESERSGVGLFDCLNYAVVLRKLNNYGIREVARDWFSTYLKDRKQTVKIKATADGLVKKWKSNGETLNHQASQDSGLSSLLFQIPLALLITFLLSLLTSAKTTNVIFQSLSSKIRYASNQKYKEKSRVNYLQTNVLNDHDIYKQSENKFGLWMP